MIKRFKRLSAVVLSTLVLVCCSDDDSGNQGIEGSWLLTSFSFNSEYDFNNDGMALANILDETNCVMEDMLVFNSDGTGSINSDDTTIDIGVDFVSTNNTDGTITITDVYDVECNEDEFNAFELVFTWEQNGNTINIMTAFQESFSLTLSGNELVNIIPNAYEFPVIENGTQLNENVIEDATLIYTKQ